MDPVLYCQPDAALRTPRSADALRRDRDAALTQWQAQRSAFPGPEPGSSREEQLIYDRLVEIWERERERIDLGLEEAGAALEDRQRPLAVVAHRHDWTGSRLRTGLAADGWDVVDAYGDAAATVAAVITRQPDLLVLSDRLLGGTGLAVVARALKLVPELTCLVQLDEEGRRDQARAAGAQLLVSHRMSITELVAVCGELRGAHDRDGAVPLPRNGPESSDGVVAPVVAEQPSPAP